MTNFMIPDAPIKLDGFPTCGGHLNDGREVENPGDLCALDGGKPATLEIVRRSIHRQMRLSLRQILGCQKCKTIPPNEKRCELCAWYRGAMSGMAGIGEQVWGTKEFARYMKIICTFDPGWQDRVEWT